MALIFTMSSWENGDIYIKYDGGMSVQEAPRYKT